MKTAFASRRVGLLALCLFLAACGGGGGGTGTTSSGSTGSNGSPRYAISGTVTLPDTAAADSDTNDPDQIGWASNDSNATAQNINTPVQLVGYLNMPGTGPAGKTYAAGDKQDIFKTTLVAGQVIELTFASNTADNDIDLLLFDATSPTTTTPVGASSSGSKRECITVTKDGSYYVMPWIVKGAAMYTLHISAANDGASCSNSMNTTALFVTGELIAKEMTSAIAQQAAANPLPQLVHVPAESWLSRLYAFITFAQSDPRDIAIKQTVQTLRYAKDLMASGHFAYVEPNFRSERLSSYAPNDPSYANQRWHYDQINLPDAMDRINALGLNANRRPIVAVIDNGVMSNHPDLQAQIVDAYSFTASRTGPGADDPRNQYECGTMTMLDSCGHGTFVAGLIAAISNNGQYGIGIAPMAQIMPIREDDTAYQQAQAILYAAGLRNSSGAIPARKSDVINISWGWGGDCPAVFADAISQARANNVMVVAAAGNTAPTKQTPPTISNIARCPGVIAVGALDIASNRAKYSAYGPALTLTAPGGDAINGVYSTKSSFASFYDLGATYGAWSGTSFSAPHVTGVIALMRYVAPGITPEQIDTLIATGRLTDDLGVPGRDDEFGQGLINARKAVDEAYALASGGSIPGAVVPLPASINFGSNLGSTTLKLRLTTSSNETVSSIVASHPAITIAATASVGASTKLGDYTINVDRKFLPAGYSNAALTVTTSARVFTVPVSITKLSTNPSPSATLGAIWVRANNLATTTTYIQRVNVSNGRYSWNLSGLTGGTYVLNASTDLDNDGNFCEPGEACGDYPGNGQTLEIGSNLSGLNFSIAPH